MRVSILSSRDTLSNIVLTLAFNVTFGLPSRVLCYYNNLPNAFFNSRDAPNLSREVIRSQYISSQPDVTRVTVNIVQASRVKRTYKCEVHVEGRVNIVSGVYAHATKGTYGTTTVDVTGKCMTA